MEANAAQRALIAESIDLAQQPLVRSSNSFTANKNMI